jgi:hypothetical protein
MISLVFNSSGLTPLVLTPLAECFQNLGANVDVNLGEANLSLSQANVGEDSLTSPINPVPSPVVAVASVVTATAIVES